FINPPPPQSRDSLATRRTRPSIAGTTLTAKLPARARCRRRPRARRQATADDPGAPVSAGELDHPDTAATAALSAGGADRPLRLLSDAAPAPDRLRELRPGAGRALERSAGETDRPPRLRQLFQDDRRLHADVLAIPRGDTADGPAGRDRAQ